jgi:hypothetical protein
MWLFVGACFGLGYGVTQRLLRLNPGSVWQGSQLFGVKPFPGTSLGALRERFGNDAMEIRGDLDLLELERKRKEDERELAQREADLKRRQVEEEQRRQQEEERQRLEQIQRESAPEPEAPALAPIESPLLSPPEIRAEPPLPSPDTPQP